MPAGTGISSWYGCWHHGSFTVVLGNLDFVLSSKTQWKSGLLTLQGMQCRGREEGVRMFMKMQIQEEALSLLDNPAGFVCSYDKGSLLITQK